MPSLSPGNEDATTFEQVLPGAPNAGFQSITTFTFRWKRYILYISGCQLNILRSPTELDQAIIFEEELRAIRVESDDTGRIAVASAKSVWILKPSTSSWNHVSWVKEVLLDNDNEVLALSWGTEGELLVAGAKELALFTTSPSSRAASPATSSPDSPSIERRAAQWSRPVPCPLHFAAFSPSCGLIATCSDSDRLVKIWRRLSFEEAIFDFAYLPHEGVVTHLQWRPADAEKLEQNGDNSSIKSHYGDEHREVLFTISADGNLRVWRTNNHNDLDVLSLYNIIDLVSAIPHSPVLTTHGSTTRPARYAFIIPSGMYSSAVAAALKKHTQRQVKHGVEHLKEVVSRDPDVIVALDTLGRMSAWGLSSIAHKRRSISGLSIATAPFHIAHSESMGLTCLAGLPTAFESWVDGDVLNILAHSFGRSVKWWRGMVEDFSSSSALSSDRGQQVAHWIGEKDKYAGLCPAAGGRLLSWTSSGRATEWAATDQGLRAAVRFDSPGSVLGVDSVQRHRSLLLLNQKEITLARVHDGKGATTSPHCLNSDDDLSLLEINTTSGEDERYMVYNSIGQYITIQVNPSRHDWASQEPGLEVASSRRESLLGTDIAAGAPTIVHFDAVMHPRKADWLRLAGIDDNGVIYRRDIACAALDDASSAMMESTLTFATGVRPAHMSITSSCAAVLTSDRQSLVVVDLKAGYIEHKQFLSERAQQIDFPSSREDEIAFNRHGLLAVVYDMAVDILARSHYDHHQSEPSHWVTIKHITLGNIGLTISSVSWLGDARLAIAAGNSIFTIDNKIAKIALSNKHRQRLELTDVASNTVEEMVSMLGGPLTCWQPNVLRELILHGHFEGVITILSALQAKLKFYTNGDELDALLDLDVGQLFVGNTIHNSEEIDFSELREQLGELDLPFTSDDDQEKLKLVVQTVSYVGRHKGSLDLNAIRYLSHWHYHVLLLLHETQQTQADGSVPAGDTSTHKVTPTMGWREINFAYHSTTQQPLLDILVQYYDNKLEWPTVRALGITLWLQTIKAAQSESHNMASIEQVFEAVGQCAYRSTQPPNPADASLFLLALRKKAVLLSLWRVAVGNREQKSTQNFLRRDFDAEENKTAARKNAYALMGKRRFEYAAAFFLLADDPISAISILAGQCEDLHLALSVARAYCGDGSSVLRSFVKERVIPAAQKATDRWLLAWANSIMEQRSKAMSVLVVDANRLRGDEAGRSPSTWQQDDPATLVFYRELRDAARTKSSLREVTLQDEYRAVLRSARILRRRGFWLLSLRLVQHWSFLQPMNETVTAIEAAASTSTKVNGGPSLLEAYEENTAREPAPTAAAVPSMLDAFSDAGNMTPAAAPPQQDEASDRAAKAAALLAKMRAKKAIASPDALQTNGVKDQAKEPTQFNEPATSSILDSFGF